MFFNKRKPNQKKCENCGYKADQNHSFCPHCGNSFLNSRKEREDFGMLGKHDYSEVEEANPFAQSFGITDKLINSVFNSMMKNMDKQFQRQFKDIEKDLDGAEVKSFPNGIRIKISGPKIVHAKKKPRARPKIKEITEEQVKKMSSLPRAKAKTSVKRLGDKVIYELATPGVISTEDVFVSKLESGYEVKAIGSKKIYINSIPINLPLNSCSILKNRLLVEFSTGEE